MATSLPTIAELSRSPTARLLQGWEELFGEPPPSRRHRELLIYAIGWEIQARDEGGLSAKTRRRLDALVGALERDGEVRSTKRRVDLTRGTTLSRTWRGRSHEVMVLDVGYAYRGRTYGSLSEIAREITGTRWSGPAFFGLRQGRARVAEVKARGS